MLDTIAGHRDPIVWRQDAINRRQHVLAAAQRPESISPAAYRGEREDPLHLMRASSEPVWNHQRPPRNAHEPMRHGQLRSVPTLPNQRNLDETPADIWIALCRGILEHRVASRSNARGTASFLRTRVSSSRRSVASDDATRQAQCHAILVECVSAACGGPPPDEKATAWERLARSSLAAPSHGVCTMMSSWWFLWLAFMLLFLIPPLGYGWGYRGWGPPYPSYVQRRRGQQAVGMNGRTGLTIRPGAGEEISFGWSFSLASSGRRQPFGCAGNR